MQTVDTIKNDLCVLLILTIWKSYFQNGFKQPKHVCQYCLNMEFLHQPVAVPVTST